MILVVAARKPMGLGACLKETFIGFISKVLDDLSKIWCISIARVYITSILVKPVRVVF